MSEATLYHSVVREPIKSQCKVCDAYNLKHYIWCSKSGFGGKWVFPKDAACKNISDEEFKKAFGDSEDEEEPFNDEDAEYFSNRYCLDCPVMQACYKDAIAWGDKYGVRGGLQAFERLY